MRVIETLVPPGGWHYKCATYRVEGFSFQDLSQKVLEYRLANQLPIGNVTLDIRTYICSNFPNNCQPGINPANITPPPQKPPTTARLDEVTQWATELQGKQGVHELVLEQEANARALVCAECPNNKAIPTGCSACGSNFNRLMTILRNGKDCAYWQKLNVCELTKQALRSAVWIKKEFLRKANNLPEKCWLR